MSNSQVSGVEIDAFITKCLMNRPLLELLFEDKIHSMEVIIEKDKVNYDEDRTVFSKMIELSGRHEIHWSSEEASYSMLSKHLDAEITPSHVRCDLLTKTGVPVEVKKDKFDAKALKQLQRYMLELNASSGIAVGSKLTCDLPSNVEFIKIKFNDDKMEWELAIL